MVQRRSQPRFFVKIGWNEETFMAYDKIALKDHSYTATRQERSRNENSWKLSLNAEVQMDHWISAMTLKMQKRHAKDCTISLQSNKSDKGPNSSSKATKNIRKDLIYLDGNIMFPGQCIRLHLRHHGGNRATAGGQRGSGTLHHGVNSDFFKIVSDDTFRMAETYSLGNRRGWRRGVTRTPTAHTLFSCVLCQRACPSLLSLLFFRFQSSRHAWTSRTCVAQGLKVQDWSASLCLAQNRHISSRNVIRYTSLEQYTLHLARALLP